MKRSPEVLQQSCFLPTYPSNFAATLDSDTQGGLLMIVVARWRSPLCDFAEVQRLPRADVEKNLELLAFFVMENRLKPSRTAAVSRLTAAGIRSLMITGDNPLAAINLARECRLSQTGAVVGKCLDHSQRSLDPVTLFLVLEFTCVPSSPFSSSSSSSSSSAANVLLPISRTVSSFSSSSHVPTTSSSSSAALFLPLQLSLSNSFLPSARKSFHHIPLQDFNTATSTTSSSVNLLSRTPPHSLPQPGVFSPSSLPPQLPFPSTNEWCSLEPK
jgi:hypothetical protein